MPTTVQCPGCGKKLKATDQLAGKSVKCPECGHVIVVPALAALQKGPETVQSVAPPHIASGMDSAVAASSVRPRPTLQWPWYAAGGVATIAVIITFALTNGFGLLSRTGQDNSRQVPTTAPVASEESAKPSASRAVLDPSSNKAAASDSIPLSISRDMDGHVVRYTVRQMDKLRQGEWPALAVFLSRAGDPVLDERLVKAEDRRGGGLASQSAISRQAAVWFAQINAEGSSILAGYRLNIYDSDAKTILRGVELTIPLSILDNLKDPDSFGFLSRPSMDWEWLGSQFSVSAAIVAFKTEEGSFLFQRFLTPVSTHDVKAKE